MTHSSTVVLLAGAADPVGQAIARAVLAAGGKVAAAVSRAWQVDKLREALGAGVADRLLVSVVAAADAEAAAGFVKGARDVLGGITHFAGASQLLRERVAGREPAGDLDELLSANLTSNSTLCRAVLASMRRSGGGRLVFAAAPADRGSLSATCRASLAACEEFANALAADLGGSVDVETVPAASESAVTEPDVGLWLAALATADAAS